MSGLSRSEVPAFVILELPRQDLHAAHYCGVA